MIKSWRIGKNWRGNPQKGTQKGLGKKKIRREKKGTEKSLELLKKQRSRQKAEHHNCRKQKLVEKRCSRMEQVTSSSCKDSDLL